MSVIYAQTIGQIVTDLLSDPTNGLGSFFPQSNFFYGPLDTAKLSAVPAVIVQNNKTYITHSATHMDQIEKELTIKLVISARDELGKSNTEVPGALSLEHWTEGIDPTTNEYDARSVAGILRRNLSLRQNSVDQDLEIDYLNPEDTDGRTIQAWITFKTTGLRTVEDRS